MTSLQNASDNEILLALGENLKSFRVRAGIAQGELARRAGIGAIAMSRLETGKGSSLRTFVNVLRSLNLQEGLNQLVPATVIDPLSITRAATPRRRIKHTRKSRKTGAEASKG